MEYFQNHETSGNIANSVFCFCVCFILRLSMQFGSIKNRVTSLEQLSLAEFSGEYARSKHSEPEWNIGNKNCLTWNIAQTYDFCIPLDFLDTKDLKKTSKGQKKFWRPNPKSKTQNFKIL